MKLYMVRYEDGIHGNFQEWYGSKEEAQGRVSELLKLRGAGFRASFSIIHLSDEERELLTFLNNYACYERH